MQNNTSAAIHCSSSDKSHMTAVSQELTEIEKQSTQVPDAPKSSSALFSIGYMSYQRVKNLKEYIYKFERI